eukprot:1152229-Pelagomonas_calceolata.AAC.3
MTSLNKGHLKLIQYLCCEEDKYVRCLPGGQLTLEQAYKNNYSLMILSRRLDLRSEGRVEGIQSPSRYFTTQAVS